ncbi:hypothetical protein [Thermopirellula anaerolimosa]
MAASSAGIFFVSAHPEGYNAADLYKLEGGSAIPRIAPLHDSIRHPGLDPP